MTLDASTNANIKIAQLFPQVAASDDPTVRPLTTQVNLERIHGHCLHNLITSAGGDDSVGLNLGMFKVPVEVGDGLDSTDMPDLFKSGDGEDFPLFMSMICGVRGGEPSENFNVIDNKSKRRLDPGDSLMITVSYQNGSTNAYKVRFHINMRLLWKLL